MKYLFIITFLLLFISCDKKEKEFQYYYIQTNEEESFFNGRSYIETSEPDTIIGVSDSSAYMEAFKKFTIAKKVSQDMKEAYGRVTKKPLSFQLLDEVGNDITYTTFFNAKDSLENELETFIFSRRNSIKESYDKAKKSK